MCYVSGWLAAHRQRHDRRPWQRTAPLGLRRQAKLRPGARRSVKSAKLELVHHPHLPGAALRIGGGIRLEGYDPLLSNVILAAKRPPVFGVNGIGRLGVAGYFNVFKFVLDVGFVRAAKENSGL